MQGPPGSSSTSPAAAAAAHAGRGEGEPGILVVVDEAPTRELLRRTLAGAGGTVDVVRTAEEARWSLRAVPHSLVVLDLVLPDADGRAFLIELIGTRDHAPVPVIVLSGAGGLSQEAECLAWGAEAFLEKPVDPSALLWAVSSALRRDRGESAHRGLPGPEELRDRFQAIAARCEEEDRPLAVVLLRADTAPGAEDRAGAAVRPAPQAAGRMVAALRPRLQDGDVVGRLGATELLVILPGRSPDEAARAVADLGGSVRIGIAQAEPGAFFEDLLSIADRDLRRVGGREEHGERTGPDAPLALRRAVLVEDDPVTAGLVRHRLERSGFSVRHHENGIVALEAIREAPPDLAVLDIRLPGMGGFEILARMRDEEALARVPVLVLTSMGSEADVARGFELGADDFLVKPFSPTELVARSLRLIRR